MKNNKINAIKAAINSWLPHHFITALSYRLSRVEYKPIKDQLIRLYLFIYPLDMSEAAENNPYTYKSPNALFTRELKPSARPIDLQEDSIVSPADGKISQLGRINNGRIFQAKGRDYKLLDLLDGDQALAKKLHNGHFATIYLSPYDYHRVHMPSKGKLQFSTYVPGRLF